MWHSHQQDPHSPVLTSSIEMNPTFRVKRDFPHADEIHHSQYLKASVFIYFNWLGKAAMLFSCQVPERFWDEETSKDFNSAWRWVDGNWIFHLWANYSFINKTNIYSYLGRIATIGPFKLKIVLKCCYILAMTSHIDFCTSLNAQMTISLAQWQSVLSVAKIYWPVQKRPHDTFTGCLYLFI